jgi:hypothetical protein
MANNNDWKAWALNITIGLLVTFLSMQITWAREDLRDIRQEIKLIDTRLTSHMLGVSEK